MSKALVKHVLKGHGRLKKNIKGDRFSETKCFYVIYCYKRIRPIKHFEIGNNATIGYFSPSG